jgi:hypothetical protein
MTTFADNQIVYFSCYNACRLGAIALNEGESIKAVRDGMGYFNLYAEWAEGSIGRYSVDEVNELAGEQVVQ